MKREEEQRVSPKVEPPKKRKLSPAEKLINGCSQAHEHGWELGGTLEDVTSVAVVLKIVRKNGADLLFDFLDQRVGLVG
jgi:hypothetical protein